MTDLKVAGLVDPAASSFAGVDLATPGTSTEASASAGEIVLSNVNGAPLFESLLALNGNLDRLPAQYSLRWLTNLRAVDLSMTTESAVTVKVAGRAPKVVPSLSYIRAALITTQPLDANDFIEIGVEGIDGKIAERPGRSADQSFAIASLRAVVADFTAPAFLAEADLIEKFFHPLIREIEVVDNVQSTPWMTVESDRDWARHEPGPGGTDRFVFGNDRISWTPPRASMLRPIFEQQFGPDASIVSEMTGTLTYDSARREVRATGDLAYSNLMELGWDVTVSRLPVITMIDLQTGAKFLAKQPKPILEKWSAAITDHGARQKALAAVGSFAKPKRSIEQVMVDFLAWIDTKAREIDPATEPLTSFAAAAIKDFVRYGGTLRLTSDQPSSVSEALLPKQKAQFDRQQILVEHTPPN